MKGVIIIRRRKEGWLFILNKVLRVTWKLRNEGDDVLMDFFLNS